MSPAGGMNGGGIQNFEQLSQMNKELDGEILKLSSNNECKYN
jgi:hypothetical protein